MTGRKCFVLISLFLLLLGLTACGFEKNNTTKIRDLEYTVLEDEEVPEELMSLIEEQKAGEFKLTFTCEGYLYIARGFGMQDTGGYSIQMTALYLTENAIYFDADLLGPTKEEAIGEVSYPYIVVKTEAMDESVVFESK